MKENRITSSELAELRREAEKLLNRNVSKSLESSSLPGEMQKVLHELAVHQIELEMQQDELLQTRAELEESLECYTDLYDFAPLGYLTLTRDGKILQANLTVCELLDIDRSRLLGDRFGRFFAVEDLPVFNALLERVFSKKIKSTCEVKLLKDEDFPSPTDPSLLSLHADAPLHRVVRIDAVLSGDGQECRVVVSDISMQKHIERENTALYARLLQPRKVESNGCLESDGAPDFSHNLLDKVIHARIRVAALSYLSVVNRASFVEIKKQVKTTDGNLSVHLRMLESAGYIRCDREVQVNKQQTVYRLTSRGYDAFMKYKGCIGSFLGM